MKRTNRREAQQVASSLRLRSEIDRLERRVQRLERTLDAMLGTTDEALIDMRSRRQPAPLATSTSASDFAAAWSDSEDTGSRADSFFKPEPDEMRARRWLLAR